MEAMGRVLEVTLETGLVGERLLGQDGKQAGEGSG